MSYQALARKWRPQQFSDVIGQEHIVRALAHALDRDRLHHAYLFTGTRGVGKTTLARIFAKCLNCEAGVSAQPCGTCTACVEIAEGRFMDMIEVDAASQRKVEQTQELLENALYAPVRGRYKVYIIDEVHMLSGHSFNALLKTLEEPPPHVKFLLATTDPQKLPATVLSRCLQFTLKNMPPEKVAEHLDDILTREQIAFERPALQLIGRAAAGSLRDAMSLADQAIAFGAGAINEAGVREMLGTVDRGQVLALADAVASADAGEALAVCARLAELGADFDLVLQDLLAAFHRAALCQRLPDLDDGIEEMARIRHLATLADAQDLQLFYQIALQGRRDLPLAPDGRSGLEMLVCRMLAFRQPAADADPGPQAGPEGGDIKKKPDALTVAAVPALSAAVTGPAAPAVLPSPLPPQQQQDSTSPVATEALVAWAALLEALDLSGLARRVAAHCALHQQSDDHWQLLLDEAYADLFQPRHAEQLAAALSAHLGRPMRVQVQPGQPADTPARIKQRAHDARLAEARRSLAEDTALQALQQRFAARLEADSVRPLDGPATTLH